MRYLGGKARISDKISEYININIKNYQHYWEPFCGAGWILSKIDSNRKRFASDIHKPLISMWLSLKNGWIPPDYISEEEYMLIKNYNDSDPLKAFVGFGCSFAGKYFGGYAGKDGRNYAKNAKNSLLNKLKTCKDIEFFCANYQNVNPMYNTFIYCDPPYINTTEFKDKFNTNLFWLWCKEMTLKGHDVLVSEYVAPTDFDCVLELNTKTDMRVSSGNKENRIERLFRYNAK